MNIVANLRGSIEKIIETANAASEPEEGEWPKQVVLGHLIDVDIEVWTARMDLMVSAFEQGLPTPEFAWWEPDPVETLEKYRELNLEEASRLLKSTREMLIAKFESLSETQLKATAKHETFGRIDIQSLMREVLIHDEEHRRSFSQSV